MKEILFTVKGDPKSQKRHRSVRMSKFIRQYDPSSKDKEDFLWLAHQHAPKEPWTGLVRMYLVFYFGRPKSHYKTGKLSNILKEKAPVFHSSKPDCDNLAKFIMDSLNGIYYKDDSQICQISIQKMYADNPRTEIVIKFVEEEDLLKMY